MSDAAYPLHSPAGRSAAPDLGGKTNLATILVFVLLLVGGIGYAVYGLLSDINGVGEPLAIGAFLLLGIALLIALGFEFVNGFHDTANAVATVIYTHSMPPVVAVVWSGLFNFLGVMVSTGAVAWGIVTLLPVELILQVGSGAGYAMIFALLIAAIVWNLGTWALGIPNSSSHALIGSVMGVGLANQLLAPSGTATSGVEWGQALNVGKALLFSPVVGFVCSALLLIVMKFLVRIPKLYEEPKSSAAPPWWIRGLLILTCTGVSFAHGGNDGQKGMGLIMLILVGVAPTAYALNRTMPDSSTPHFIEVSQKAEAAFKAHQGAATSPAARDATKQLSEDLKTKKLDTPEAFAALSAIAGDISHGVQSYGSIQHVPASATSNMRNEMFMVSDAIRLMPAGAKLTSDEGASLKAYKSELENGTRFIPTWVKVSVAIALGLGTMIGWKRIVVTVGEKIGKTHLTYAQGASAETVAAVTILGAEFLGLPVSTTHILSSGVAGTMAANGSGLQMSTVRSIAMAWITTLPAAMLIAGVLFAIFRAVF